VGFAIEFREPGNTQFHPIKNRIAFPGQRKTSNDPPVDSTKAPFQKFRWVTFPVRAGKEGTFIYRVTPMFMDDAGKLTAGESQSASSALMRETIRGKLNVAFLFSLAFLGQTTKGTIGPALGRKLGSLDVFTLGIADASIKAGNLGITVITPDNQRHLMRSSALTGNVPPFRTEPSGLSGNHGTRMHHKFVVLDFDTPDARVHLGSYNFSEPADGDNGENLLLIKDRTVVTSFMIEAMRLYDAYLFRNVNEDKNKKGKGKKKILELALPPKTDADKPWWQKYWDDPLRKRDRTLFA